MNKVLLVSAGVVAIGLGGIAFANPVSAHGLGNGVGKFQLDSATREEIRSLKDQMKTAIENKDYATWQSVVSQLDAKIGRTQTILSIIDTESEFLRLSEMHAYMKDGNFTEAQKIREELGLPALREGKGFRKQINQSV